MFGNRYFGTRYFADRYFGQGGAAVIEVLPAAGADATWHVPPRKTRWHVAPRRTIWRVKRDS